ncbi:unnamed protein product [Strongylus vulgaris]|uniref:p53 DNA-binding domain-containing protein n=1 Tax=Strongylus vulgaris TaxID=40348 RepID=A0A3P7J8G2_STRVU|nr:unnamed protein product [Strongylus vulgaris]
MWLRLSSNEGITLYCKADTSVPFNFHFHFGEECHPNVRVRVRPEYTEDRYANKPVERCPNHLVKDNTETRNHFLRCEHPQAEYLSVEDAYAVRIPMCESTGFMFTCFSSCSGGINRRPVQLAFILEERSCSGGINRRPVQLAFILEERNGRVVDTCYIALKVCANPLRDASKENGRFESRLTDPMFAGVTLQRKRGNRFTSEIVKRPNFRGYLDETSASWELHLTDIRKARKVVWLLMNEDKFDQLMSMAKEGNMFRDFCTLTADTPIKE